MRKGDLPTRILGIFAHEDDEVVGGGGLLARNSAEKGNTKVICFGGSDDRRLELEASCKVIGAECSYFGYKEPYDLQNFPEVRKRIIGEILEFKPQFIVTHSPEDYHPDHTAVSKQVEIAANFASNRGWRVGGLLLTESHQLFSEYDIAVDITGHLDKKLEAMRCHTSQLKKGEEYYLKLIKQKAVLRGVQSGVEHAEAFRYKSLPIIGMFNDEKLAL